MASIRLQKDGKLTLNIPAENQVFFYLVKGELEVNGRSVNMRELVQFELEEGEIEVLTIEDAYILFGHGKPFNEVVVSQGPFVMNTADEIRAAYQDYREGKMGVWK